MRRPRATHVPWKLFLYGSRGTSCMEDWARRGVHATPCSISLMATPLAWDETQLCQRLRVAN